MQRRIINLQALFVLIINKLQTKPLAVPLAKPQTSAGLFAKFRLRIQTILRGFANVKPLYFSYFWSSRLQYRLQSCQLSTYCVILFPLALCLQKQMFLQTVCKEKSIQYQSINKSSFAALFAKISN